MFLGGMQIIENPNLLDQYCFPRSKRKRIRKKWGKDMNNYAPSTKIWQTAGRIICHPMMAQQIKRQMAL